MLMSTKRDLGRGYLVNISGYPDIKKANFDYKEKLSYIVTEVKNWENILVETDVVIQKWKNDIVRNVMLSNKKSEITLSPVKYGDNFIWSDDGYLTNKSFIREINKYSKMSKERVSEGFDGNDFILEGMAKVNNSTAKYSFAYSCWHAYYLAKTEIKKIILKTKVKDSYNYFSWVPTAFSSWLNYNYITKIGVTPKSISEYNIVYFPLHLEPERSLLNYSPEFTNVTEAIHIISKVLPSNYVVVVKEHPYSFAVRGRDFYHSMSQIGNVFFSDPTISSLDWIESSKIVGAITGTVGTEAVYSLKPVLSFGQHQIINNLKTVFYVSNYAEAYLAVKSIIGKALDLDSFYIAKTALSRAQMNVSFDFPEYKYMTRDSSLCIDVADKAVKNLIKEYPSCFT